MRLIGLFMMVGLLSGCILPPSHRQEFAVTGEIPPQPTPTIGYHNSDPNVNDTLAKNICADGYKKLDEKVLPAMNDNRDHEQLKQWRVKCTDRVWGLFQTT